MKPTNDPKILQQLLNLNYSSANPPGFYKTGQEYDKLHVKMINKWNLVHTIFFEYHGGPKKDEVTIIPLEIDMMFFAGLRQGIGSRFGPN